MSKHMANIVNLLGDANSQVHTYMYMYMYVMCVLRCLYNYMYVNIRNSYLSDVATTPSHKGGRDQVKFSTVSAVR